MIINDAALIKISPVAKYEENQSEIITQLNSKYKDCGKGDEKFRILTTLPMSCTIKQIQNEFNVSYFMAQKTGQIQKENRNKCVEEKSVLNFYESDNISRVCPGKRDCKILLENGIKIKKQKRLILCNLYQEFKKQSPLSKIGSNKFCELRPKNCIFANANGVHNVCVC